MSAICLYYSISLGALGSPGQAQSCALDDEFRALGQRFVGFLKRATGHFEMLPRIPPFRDGVTVWLENHRQIHKSIHLPIAIDGS